MIRWKTVGLKLGLSLVGTLGFAQVTGNGLMPPPIDLTRSGWDTTLQNGNLTFGLPLANVPGEIPIPVGYGLNATYIARSWTTRVYDPDLGKSVPVINETDRPMVGGVHFGYIAPSATYSGTTVPGLTVLESGAQIADSQWTAFSANSTLGGVLNLPQAFGFTAVSTSVAMVDPTGTYLTYSTSISGINPTYQSIITANLPTNFGTPSSTYKVVMDKNRARVYAWAASVNAWVPVLWADRFGHYVTLNWIRATTGLPSGITAITKVTVTNQHSKGVVLRWADYSSYTSVVDLLRLDYVGVHAPSVLVQGYPSYSRSAPVGYVTTSPDNQWWVVPSIIGASGRPVAIQVGAYGSIAQPSWNGSGSSAGSAPGTPPADGTADSNTRTWSFAYDGNLAELTSYTDSNGLTTSFTFVNYTALGGMCPPRGVSEVHAVDSASRAQWKRWTRTFSSTLPTTLSIKVEGWWDPNQLPGGPDRYHQIVFPTDSLNYGNGVPQTDTLIDTLNKVWSTTTYSWNATGSGLNAGLSSVQAVTVQQDNTPDITTALGYKNSTNLQISQQNVSAKDSSGTSILVSQTLNTYSSRWDMLEGYQLGEVDTTQFVPDGKGGVVSLGTVAQKNVYDAPASGPALLQLQQSYLDGGSVGKHGYAYTYDSQGRVQSQQVYHLDGTQTQILSNSTAFGYDTSTGAIASQTMSDLTVTPHPTLGQTASGFDSAGRPTTITDATGVSTTYSYDDRGRVLSVTRPGSPAVNYTYPTELQSQVTSNGLTTFTDYDGFGRVVATTTPTGVKTGGGVGYTTQTPTYDFYGRVTRMMEINPAGTVRNRYWTYDTLDRQTSLTPYVGGGTTTAFAVSGIYRKVTTTLSNQISSTSFIDPLGQVVEMDSPDGSTTKRTTTATLDGTGRLITSTIQVTTQPTTGTAQTRSWTYDALGQLLSKTEPETNTQTFSSNNGLLQPTWVVEAANTGDARSRGISYDGFGRMTFMGVGGGDQVSYTYTGAKLTDATRKSGGLTVTQHWEYTAPGGALSSETTTQSGLSTTIGYAYDPQGRLVTLTYPDLRTAVYGYDAFNRVKTIMYNNAALVSNVGYDDWGNRSQIQFASGALDNWEADLTGTRLNHWNIGYVGGGPDARTYTYDDAKNVLSSIVLNPLPQGATQEWTFLDHDNMGHLKEADGFGITTKHTYDAFGNNLTSVATPNGSSVPSTVNSFTFNSIPNNQIPGLDSNGALTGWNTNLRGEATQVGAATASSTVYGLSWDGLGLLQSINWNNGSESFLYAPTGMRVRLVDQVSGADTRQYAYTSGGLLLTEYKNPTGTPVWNRDVVYLGTQAVAEINADGVHELHSDHLGSPRLVTRGPGVWSDIGKPEEALAYGPYGELINSTGLNGYNYVPLTGYTGHIQADVTGLIYMRGRYYSPSWHAFVNSDQGVDPSTWNQRAYVGGSPFMGVDPSGMVLQQFCINGQTALVNGWYENGVYRYDSVYWTGDSCSSGGGLSGGGGNSGGNGNDGGGDMGKTPPPPTPPPPPPPKPNDCQQSDTVDNSLITGSGFFYGGAAELSTVAPIAAGSFSKGIGGVSGERLTFSSSGGTSAIDAQSRGDWGWGANAGVGAGIWFTNAKSANALSGPSRSTDISILFIGFTFSRNTDGSWVFQYGLVNRGGGIGVHHYTTNTSVTKRCN